MTLQVALRGSDGIVLASDKQRTVIDVRTAGDSEDTLQLKERSVRWLAKGTKIQVSEKHCLAIATAGHKVSSLAAGLLLEDLQNLAALPADLEGMLTKVCDRAYEMEFGDPSLSLSQQRAGGTLIVVAPNRKPDPIIRANIASKSFCYSLSDKAIAGDAVSPAVFFVERYYDDGELWPVAALKFLAAHTILTGAQLNNAVEGLEIAVCTSSGIQRETINLAALKKASLRLDEAIKQKLLLGLG